MDKGSSPSEVTEILQFSQSFQPHHGLGVKHGQCIRLTTYLLSVEAAAEAEEEVEETDKNAPVKISTDKHSTSSL
jgi:hypothetical protein